VSDARLIEIDDEVRAKVASADLDVKEMEYFVAYLKLGIKLSSSFCDGFKSVVNFVGEYACKIEPNRI